MHVVHLPPSQAIYDRSAVTQSDSYYKLDNLVATFVARANNELRQYGLHAAAWTLNRSVSIFKGAEVIYHVYFDEIEWDIVAMLDILQKIAKEEADGPHTRKQ